MLDIRSRDIWLLLLAGPVLFLLVMIAVSVVLGASGVPAEEIGAEVPRHASVILLVVLAMLGLFALWRLPVRALWADGTGARLQDAVIGAAVGVGLAVAYLWLLAPLMEWLQRVVGDYVPPGEVLATVSGQILPFFLANVLLAPVVEETIYRGAALRGIAARSGRVTAVILSCLAFGALHWTGGIWYMVLTAVVAGGAFAGLALWRGGLMAPFAAHLALNTIEFAAAVS
jgi:membrane protease YdiL (CAAX protease family)